jgi:FMN phosphatase YigB (HAD superfamily)
VNPRKAGTPVTSDFQLHTFDVFDTLVTRVWIRPADAFIFAGLECARVGLVEVDAEQWCRRRQAAEASLRRRFSRREIKLAEIYDELSSQFGWNASQTALAMNIELDCERQSLRPVAPMIGRAHEVLSSSGRLACISDFYAPRSFVQELLRDAGIALGNEELFVSSDEGVTKHSGLLFSQVAIRTGVLPSSIRHVGDHPNSDDVKARQAGFVVAPYRGSAALPAELLLTEDGETVRERLIASAIGGSARRARLDNEVEDGLQVLRDVATAVAGPLLFGYVYWLLVKAQESGIRRLYFLSRDGQILERVARVIATSFDFNVELRYLFASRRAWFLASTAFCSAEARVAAVTSDGTVVLNDLLGRLEIHPDRARDALEAAGFPEAQWSKAIASERVAQLRRVLGSFPVRDLIAARAVAEHRLCVEYLRSEGVLDGSQSAIVDVGWKGRLQTALARILRGEGAPDPVGFYLALRERPLPSQMGSAFTYLDQQAAFSLNPTLTEAFCAADHGTVLGYRRSESDAVAAHLAAPDGALRDWGVEFFQECVVDFAKKMTDAMHTLGEPPELVNAVLRRSAVRAVRRFVDQPTRNEADVFGSFPHDASQLHTCASELAPTVPANVLLRSLVRPTVLDAHTHWQQASIVRSARFDRVYTRVWKARLEWGSWLKTRLAT